MIDAKGGHPISQYFVTRKKDHRTEKTPLQTSGHFRRFFRILNFMQSKYSESGKSGESPNWPDSGFAGARIDGRSLCARSYNRADCT
jgi:hypothetical protein